MSLNISLVIPTCNMASHLPRLFHSLSESGLLTLLAEVLLVDDGSTDATPNLLEAFAANNPQCVKVLRLETNVGRFHARWEGAKAASCEKILFLDTRLELETGFTDALTELAQKHNSIMGVVNIDTSTSVFALYWERSHRALFRKHFEAADQGFFLTQDNYDQFLKGTTVFVCLRADFIHACEQFKDVEIFSDDTALMKVIVGRSPIWVDSRLAIRWWPRETATEFLHRLWERGPSFVEYHIFIRRSGPSFWIVITGLIATAGALISCALFPRETLLTVLAVMCAMAGTAVFFAKSPTEFLRILPLHLAVLVTFGLGIVQGVFVNLMRVARGRFPNLSKVSTTLEGQTEGVTSELSKARAHK